MKILVKWPTRSRSDKFLKTLRLYQETRVTDNVHFLITIDSDDHRMLQRDVINTMKKWGNLRYEIIEPCGKIGAINSGVEAISRQYDIIVLASDDMIPVVKGWDKRIADDMERLYPDTDGVLWYNDGYVGDKLNTLCILGTKYYRRFNYIYNPEYKALWCDNEFMDVANQLGKQTYFQDVIIRHEHPIWQRGKKGNDIPQIDHLHHRDNLLYHEDERTYNRRKSDNFGITAITKPIDTDTGEPEGAVRESAKGDQQADSKPKRRRKSSSM